MNPQTNEKDETHQMATLKLPDHYSHSSLQRFENCPGSWFDHYILGVDEDVGDNVIVGSMMHELTKAYDGHSLGLRCNTHKSMEPVIFDTLMKTHPEAVHLRQELEGYFHDYVDRTIVPIETLVGIEEELKVTIDINGKPREFVGIPDRVENLGDGSFRIGELKMDGAIRSQVEVEKDKQLQRYAWLVWQIYGATSIEAYMHFLRYGVEREVTGLEEIVESVGSEIAQRIEIIEEAFDYWQASDGVDPHKTHFPYTVGHACSMCGFARKCPKLKELADEAGNLFVAKPEDAQLAASTLISLEAKKKHVTDLLKSWCSEHGNIVTGGKDVGFRKRESYDYPVVPLLGVLDKFSLEHTDFLKADTTTIKRAMKGDAELAKELDAIRQDKSTTVFTMVKAKE